VLSTHFLAQIVDTLALIKSRRFRPKTNGAGNGVSRAGYFFIQTIWPFFILDTVEEKRGRKNEKILKNALFMHP